MLPVTPESTVRVQYLVYCLMVKCWLTLFFFFFHFYSRSSHLVEWIYTNQAFQCQSVPAGNCSNWFPLSRTSIKLSIVRRAGGIIWEGRKPLVNTAWGLSWRVPCTTKQIYDSGNLSTLTDFIWLLHGDSVLEVRGTGVFETLCYSGKI